jgi:hypothetical protein
LPLSKSLSKLKTCLLSTISRLIVIKDNDFSLWFGEAKFYLDIDRAITSAVDSVDAFLRSDDQIKKEWCSFCTRNEMTILQKLAFIT